MKPGRPTTPEPILTTRWSSALERLEERMLCAADVDVALIDRTLPDHPALVRALHPGGKVFLYDGGNDSAEQILSRLTDWAERTGNRLRSISLMSHGAAGRFALGNDWITKSSLDETKDEWQRLGKVLADGASINLFGCNLIAGDGDGKVLINRLSKLVGATVFASTDLTGRGGDWVLEATSRNARGVRAGVAASPHPFSVKKLSRFAGSLASSLGSETLVNTTTTNIQRTHEGAQAVATDASGNFVIVWSGNGTGDADGIFAQRYNALGVPQGSELRVNTTTSGTQTSPAVAMDADGDFVIVWSGQGAGDTTGIFAQRYNAAGVAQGGEFIVNNVTANVQQQPSVAMSDAGAFVITWTSAANADGSGRDIYMRRYNAAGVQQGLQTLVNFTTSTNEQEYSRVATDGAGNFVVTWASVINTSFGWGIAAQRFTAAGAAIGSEIVVNSTYDSNQQYPVIAMSAGGAFVIAWQSYDQDSNETWGIYAQRFSSAGATQGGEFLVTNTTANDQQFPSIAIDDAGNFTVAWQSNAQDGSLSGIYARDYGAAGTAEGNEYLVNATTANNQQISSVAMDSNGDFVVVWSGNGAGDVDGVFMQRYRSNSAGIMITQAPGLTTTEAGGSAAFTVALAHQPTSDVTLTFTSSATGEGTVSPGSITFTPLNWNVARTVTITGVNDDIDDGNVTYTISTLASSSDAAYHGLAGATVSVTNDDDADTAGVNVSLVSGPTTEAGGMATFTVVLTSQPLGDVTINLVSSNTGEGVLSTSSLTFTALNWNVAQSVDVTGVDDFRDDGDVIYTIETSAASAADSTYDGMEVANVSLSNTDDDTFGIIVSPTSGLTTTEAGGTATFTIVLTSQPAANVVINLSSSDTTEGTLDRPSVTFTPDNWDDAQTVMVTGVDDDFDDGDGSSNPTYSIITAAAVSGDGQYNGMNTDDVALTNTDDDAAGFTIEWLTPQVTTESGGTARFRIRLNAEPTAAVVISINSSDNTEASATPNNYSLNGSNWSEWRTITVTGLDDALLDGDVDYILQVSAASSDARYDGLAQDLDVTNLDNDTPGITVTPGTTAATPLLVSETATQVTFDVVLKSQPTQNVVINLILGDGTEATLSVTTLTFTPLDWNTPKQVTVTGLDDFIDDGNVDFTITLVPSGDSNYAALPPAVIPVVHVRTEDDADTAGVLVSPISGPTTESSGTATYSVVLRSEPLGDVEISVVSGDTTEGQVLTTLRFTPNNWDTPQMVTVTGVDDAINDGDIHFVVVHQPSQSTDANYSGLTLPDVTVTNLDDDPGSVLVTLMTPAFTTEGGGRATLRIVLDSRPTEDVTIQLFSSNEGEGILSDTLLVFTPDDWDTPQFVDVVGVDDGIRDAYVPYAISFTTSSDGADFDGLAVADVALTNRDTSPYITTGAGVGAVTENDAPRPIDADLLVDDADGLLTGATVRITAGYVRGEDLLAFTSAHGIGGAWDSNSGTLTLTGSATVAQYQDALRTVTYQNTSDDPSAAPRTISFIVTDGNDSAGDAKAVSVQPVNDAPIGVAETYAASAGSDFVINSDAGVLSNDSDPDDATGDLTAVLVTGPTLGQLTLNPDGSFTYTPTDRAGGTDTFVYRATDGQDAGEPVTVTITVSPAAEEPETPTDPPSPPPPPPPQPPIDEEPIDPEPPEKPDRPKPAPRPSPRPEKPNVNGPMNPVPPSERPATPPPRVQPPTVTRERQDVTFTRAITIEAATTDFGYQPIPVEATPGNSELPVIEIPALPKWEITETFTQSLDQLGDQLTAETQTANTAAAVVGSAALVWVGYVVYSLRGGALLLTFLTSMPLWRTLDPLPVLEASEARAARRKNKKKRDDRDQEDPDERNLRSVLG